MDEPGRVSLLPFIFVLLLASSSTTGAANANKEPPVVLASSAAAASGAGKVELVLYYETLCPYCSNFIVNYLDKVFLDPHSDLSSIVDLHLIPYGNAKISSNNSISCQVSLGLYYETLCPYSADFVVNYLASIFDDGLISIVDLSLVPFGNAKIRGNNTIDCQHGPSECLLNTIEACAINAWPSLSVHFPFIYCVESLVYDHKYPQWEECFDKLGLDPKPISDCYNSGYGKELELRYAAETNNLQPPHKYVPWVVVDGEPLYEDYQNFVDYVCKAYRGTSLPKACSKASLKRNAKYLRNPMGKGCYTEEIVTSLFSGIRSVVKKWMDQMDLASAT